MHRDRSLFFAGVWYTYHMNIEWWMLDGIIALIVLAAAIIGAVKGIGDTILRIAGIIGGAALGFIYSDRVSEWLADKKFSLSLHDHIYEIIRGESEETAGGVAVSGTGEVVTPDGDTSFLGSISRSLGDIFTSAADRTAEEAATRLTDIALGIFSFAIILLVTALAVLIVRLIIKALLDRSIVLGFADRILGFTLGAVRGLLIAWVVAALLIPATTLFSPEKVPAMIEALQHTTITKVLYDVNPLLLLVKYVFKA